MEPIEEILKVISESPTSLAIKAISVAVVIAAFLFLSGRIKRSRVNAEQDNRAKRDMDNDQKLADDNETANDKLSKDKDNVDKWAEDERKKDDGK